MFGEYKLVERIVRATRFQTWLAQRSPVLASSCAVDEMMSSAVVLKTCHLGHGLGRDDVSLVELERALDVRHPGVARLHEVGVRGGVFFAVTEYVRGRDLSRVLGGRSLIEPCTSSRAAERASLWPSRPLPSDLALLISLKVCEGLEQIHDRTGRAHGELCPWHVMVGFDGEVKLLNVGLSSIASQLKADSLAESWAIFRYKAPEQILGGEVDRRVDTFSLGLVLSELILGRPLVGGDADSGLLSANRYDVGRSVLPELSASPAIAEVLFTALKPEPSERFQSAREMGLALREAMTSVSRCPTTDDLATMMWRRFQRSIRACESSRGPLRSCP